MSAMFDQYQNIPDTDTNAKSLNESIERPAKGKTSWVLKKLKKQMKRHNKLLKRLLKQPASKATSEEPKASKENGTEVTKAPPDSTNMRKEKTFLEKLEDAIIKAVPAILRTIAAVAIPLLFTGRSIFGRSKGLAV